MCGNTTATCIHLGLHGNVFVPVMYEKNNMAVKGGLIINKMIRCESFSNVISKFKSKSILS